jgi:hypothetical protein
MILNAQMAFGLVSWKWFQLYIDIKMFKNNFFLFFVYNFFFFIKNDENNYIWNSMKSCDWNLFKYNHVMYHVMYISMIKCTINTNIIYIDVEW